MPHVDFNFKNDFENIVQKGLSSAQFQLLQELFQKYKVDLDELYYIMHKSPKAIGFEIGDRVLYLGYTHLRPNQNEFVVYEIEKLHVDCLTDVTIRPIAGGNSQRVYHRDLVKINK